MHNGTSELRGESHRRAILVTCYQSLLLIANVEQP